MQAAVAVDQIDQPVVVRPEDIHLGEAGSDRESTVEGEVVALVYMGEALDCQVRLGLHPSAAVAEGAPVRLAIHGRACRALVC